MDYVYIEFIGVMSTTVILCWLLHRTTNIAYWIGLSDKDKNDTHI